VTKAVRSTTPQWGWPDNLFREILPVLVKKGYLSQEIMDAFLLVWKDRSTNPNAIFFGSPVLETIGRLQPC